MLITAVFSMYWFGATDSRDRIFAALGFHAIQSHSFKSSMIRVDYTSADDQVYVDFAINALNKLPKLSLLWYLEGSEQRLRSEWPSWVPILEPYGSIEPLSLSAFNHGVSYDVWDCCETDTKSALLVDVESRRLTVTAVQVTYIEAVVSLLQDNFDYAAVMETLRLCSAVPCLYNYSQRPQSRIEALWRTMIANLSEDGCCPPRQKWQIHFDGLIAGLFVMQLGKGETEGHREVTRQAWLELRSNFNKERLSDELPCLNAWENIELLLRTLEQPADEADEDARNVRDLRDRYSGFTTTYDIAGKNRQIFRCQNSMLGNGPRIARSGDQVWFLENLNVPMILRPMETENEFKIVGECYLHGCMNGELFRDGQLDAKSGKPIVII